MCVCVCVCVCVALAATDWVCEEDAGVGLFVPFGGGWRILGRVPAGNLISQSSKLAHWEIRMEQ